MILEGKVGQVEARDGYLHGKGAKVATITCPLTGPAKQSCAITLSVPIVEAEHWPLGMPVTVTVEKGEPE